MSHHFFEISRRSTLTTNLDKQIPNLLGNMSILKKILLFKESKCF